MISWVITWETEAILLQPRKLLCGKCCCEGNETVSFSSCLISMASCELTFLKGGLTFLGVISPSSGVVSPSLGWSHLPQEWSYFPWGWRVRWTHLPQGWSHLPQRWSHLPDSGPLSQVTDPVCPTRMLALHPGWKFLPLDQNKIGFFSLNKSLHLLCHPLKQNIIYFNLHTKTHSCPGPIFDYFKNIRSNWVSLRSFMFLK